MPNRNAKQIGRRIAPVLLLFASPWPVRAQDKIEAVKANVTSEIRDPKIIIPPIKNEPRWKFRKPLEDRSRRRFILLSVGVYAAAAMDMQESVSLMPRFHEDDPFTKPFARLPVPAYYATGLAFATGFYVKGSAVLFPGLLGAWVLSRYCLPDWSALRRSLRSSSNWNGSTGDGSNSKCS